jgi:hypothetical protein
MSDGPRKKKAEEPVHAGEKIGQIGRDAPARQQWASEGVDAVGQMEMAFSQGSASSDAIAALLWMNRRVGNQPVNQSLAVAKESPGQKLIREATLDRPTRRQLVDRARSNQDVSGSILEKIMDDFFDPSKGRGLQGNAGLKLLPVGIDSTTVEYIPGDRIRDSRGKLAADGLVLNAAGESGARPVVGHLEAKAGEASAAGLHIGKGESDEVIARANRQERIRDIYSDLSDAQAGWEREYAEDRSWSPALLKRVKGKDSKQRLALANRLVDNPAALKKLGLKYIEAEAGGQFSSANERMREFDSIRVYKRPPRTDAEVHDPANYEVVRIEYNNKTVRVAVTPADVSTSATLASLEKRGWPAQSLKPAVTAEELKIEQAKIQREASRPPTNTPTAPKSLPVQFKPVEAPVNVPKNPASARPTDQAAVESVAEVRPPLKAYTGVATNYPVEGHGGSLKAARWEAGANAATLGLEALNWGIHYLANAKREEIVNAELAKLDPILAERMAQNPQLGARVVIVYDQFEGNRESPLQPPATFARLEWSLGRNEREARQRWEDEPKLRRGLVAGEQETMDVRWYPPSQPTTDIPMPDMPFPSVGLATFAPGRASLLQVAIWANSGFDDEQDFTLPIPKGGTPRFHVLQLPERFTVAVNRPEGLDSADIRTPLVERRSAANTSVPAVNLDTMMPFSDASAVCIFPADEFTLQLLEKEGPRTLGNPTFYSQFQHIYWVRPENMVPLK